MSTQLDIRPWVEGWLRDHRGQLQAKHVTYEVKTDSSLPKAKAVLQFEAPSALMQIDLWGSGEVDVMEMKHGEFSSQHKNFENQRSLLQILDSCIRKLAPG
jgi:hypothetical protein